LQLHEGFGFADATSITPYLEELGITHLYLSPLLQARSGSQHGYDVVDHQLVNAELGGLEGLQELARRWNGQIILDIVPNHMAVNDPANRWWWDVLKNGPASDYAEYFDIDWNPSEDRLKRSILLPILGDHYGRVLDAGDLEVTLRHGEPCVRYYEHVFPLAPSSRPHDLDLLNRDHERLHELLEAQHYRLAHWKVAGQDLNYRRFFAINDLAGLRIDRQEVFEAVHETIFTLVDSGVVHGLRVDHIDGLRYPLEYLQRLRARCRDCYIVVEKILEGDEQLRGDWPVQGTTGYEFIAQVSGLFIAPDAEKPLTDIYERFTGSEDSLGEMAIEAKLGIMDTELATDVGRLTELFVAVCEDQPRYRDFTRPELRRALQETLASFPVYRTYIDPRMGAVAPEDIRIVERATDEARARRPDLDPELFELLRDVLLLRLGGEDETALALRFQQVSGPVMAKGIEDTLFYRYNRFAALNEVGGDPARFGVDVDEFHSFNRRVQEVTPDAMLASSTHDTKRSEDVRARLSLLSEIPDEWGATVARWSQDNERFRDGEWPDRTMEYLLYQTLVGAWPLSTERAVQYMAKAAREAKIHTSWIAPNEPYDAALSRFVTSVTSDAEFMAEVEMFVEPLVGPGYVNSLAQTLLKLTSPGVPDFYQGTEVWDLSLVDPDNRQPIDYAARRELLRQMPTDDAGNLWPAGSSGASKMLLVSRALGVRSRHEKAFGPQGDYEPLYAVGARADHVVAYVRGDAVITIVPRLVLSLGDTWADTMIDLPGGPWSNVFTGDLVREATPLSEILGSWPVALFERQPG
jgi:(1->4)-alpha-D-glucan 1-alpha-D-glucosylmutase